MQTPEGAKKAKETMLRKYGHSFYAEIGQKGGKLGRTGGFYKNPEAARIAGAKGGKAKKK